MLVVSNAEKVNETKNQQHQREQKRDPKNRQRRNQDNDNNLEEEEVLLEVDGFVLVEEGFEIGPNHVL